MKSLSARLRTQWPGLLLVLAVAVLAFPFLRASYNYTYATLGRDTGIYQFVAWAMRHGQKPYVDVRENNGPLIYLLHLLFLALGAADEHRFRLFDWLVQASAYAIGGYVAAGPWTAGTTPSRGRRLICMSFGVMVLTSQYLVFDWWATAQRESTYDAILLAGLSLQLRMHQRLHVGGAGPVVVDRRLMLAASIAVASTCFGKPTYALCSLVQVGVLWIDPATRRAFRSLAVRWLIGTLGTALAFLLWIALFGDVANFVRIVLLEAPRYYVPIWKQTWFGTYALGHNGPLVDQGIVTLVAMVVLLALGWLPRAFVLAAFPLAFGLLTFFGQRKGFYYHLHPVLSGAYWLWVLGAGYFWERLATPKWSFRVGFLLLAGVASYQALGNLVYSDFYNPPWMPAGRSESARNTREFYAGFHASDFDGFELRRAAEYLRAHTRSDQGVQVYGIEPYLLFLAERRTATPYIYAYDLNMDPALAGGPGGRPEGDEAEAIRQLQARNARDLDERVRQQPPGAFVLIDNAPMAYAADALIDFRQHCPGAGAFLDERYVESARFGTFRVFLPR